MGKDAEKAEGNRLLRMEVPVGREILHVHDEVMKRLRKARYKAGWMIKLKSRLIPEVWFALRSEFQLQAAGAEVEVEGNKQVILLVDVDVVSRVFFEDHLVSGRSKFAEEHGIFCKYFCKPPEEFLFLLLLFKDSPTSSKA